MAVYRIGKFYYYDFEFSGERFKASTKTKNLNAARQIEAAKKTELAKAGAGIVKQKPSPLLKEFVPRFIEAMKSHCSGKPRTAEFYRARAEVILTESGWAEMRLDRIDEEEISLYIRKRSKVKSRLNLLFAPASVNRELATLRRMLRLAHEWKLLNRVPRIRLLRGERIREFVLPKALEETYLAACPEQLASVAVLLLDTGMRLGEALSLSWRQVNLEPYSGAKLGSIAVLGEKSKNGRTRVIPLTPRAAALLRSLEPGKSGLVFERKDGEAMKGAHLGQQQARVRDLLKLPEFVLHSLRHTFGTRLGEYGADAFTIMRLMGHSTVTVSQRYVHPTPETMERAVERMAAGGAEIREVPRISPLVDSSESKSVQ